MSVLLTDQEIIEFRQRIIAGLTTVSDDSVLIRLIEQCVAEATGNAGY